MKTIIAPEDHKYINLPTNSKVFTKVEVLPDLIPTYVRVDCKSLASPAQIEINMTDLDAMQVLVSNNHKFPCTAGGPSGSSEAAFEKEKLLVVDPRIEQALNRQAEEEIAALVAASK